MPAPFESLPQPLPEADKANPEYAPQKLEGIDQVSAGAITVLQDAMEGKRRIGTSETDRGLRGIVEAPVPGGDVTGLFEGRTLDQITITLHGEEGNEHNVRIDKPESGTPMLFLDGIAATAEDMPSVVAVIEQIKSERETLKQRRESELMETKDTEEDQDGYELAA